MIENLSDVKRSKFLNSLDRVALSFGLESCYADISEKDIKGVYFFCGNNVSELSKNETRIRLAIKENTQNTLFDTDIKAFKLTDNEDFVTHQHIMQYMRNLEMLNRVYGKSNKNIPLKLDNEVVFSIRNLYINSENRNLSPAKRNHYEKLLNKVVDTNEMLSKHKSEYDKMYYDSGKSRIANFFRKHFGKHLNNVSLKHLTAVSNTVKTISIREEYRDKIIRALDGNPQLLYYISDTTGEKLNVPDSEGLGSARANDMRKFTLSFDEAYISEFMNVIDKELFPELYKTSPEELCETYGELISFAVPLYEYDNLISLCKANNIPISYDVNRDGDLDIDFVVPKQYEWEIEGVLSRLAQESEDFKIAPHGLTKSTKFEEIPNTNNNVSFNSFDDFIKAINEPGQRELDNLRDNQNRITPDR